jgi:tetratricopeptide (TPR) repeat protein
MSEHDQQPTDDDSQDGRDPLKRRIAVTLASLVLLGGALAIVQTDASVKESNTARETTRVAVRAMQANVAQNAILSVQSQLLGERAFLPYRSPLAQGATLLDAVGIPPDRAQTAADLREAAKGLPTRRAQKALDRLGFTAERRTLKQRALATTRVTWNTRSTQYTTVLTVLAAALFLVGLGLIVEGQLRRYTYALGVAIGLFALGWGVWVYHLPIPFTSDRAIADAARGEVLSNRDDFRGAIRWYDRAIAANGGFATAYTGRGIARLLAANPDYRTTRAFTGLHRHASEDAEALRDINRALDLGGHRDFTGLLVSGLLAFYEGQYQRSVDDVDAALAINPKVPEAWLLKSAGHLALGQGAEAAATRQKAVDLLAAAQPSKRIRLLASSYLSYLAWIARYEPGLAGEARRLSDEAVATETAFTLGRTLSGSLPMRGGVHVDGLRYANGRLRMRVGYEGLPKGTAITGLVYERPLEGGAWTQPTDLALFLNASGAGTERFSVPLKRACKPTEVRVDVFLNGVPALSRTGPGVGPTC